MFGIITVISVLAVLFVLSSHRFRNSPDSTSKVPTEFSLKIYFPWLGSRIMALFRVAWIKRSEEMYNIWFIQRYPPAQRWIFICLALSFCYQILSGIVFALLGLRLFGLFLLLHVTLGGLFAVCLCLAVVLRARYYVWDTENFMGKNGALNLKTKAGIRKLLQVILFWIFVVSGFVLIITALSQMLPSFSLRTQLVLLEVHRYAALESLLAAMAFFYFSLIDDSL
ncbi:MAG: hypothetical protein OEY18_05160 [Candidatus Aminicenantes bacterium]|nr:hypothetical protein [Candidatus Aminicenantes bacterium]MDH5384078.1 hypothetical protein [Candidatus Aminicenantes bacterium]MDH5742094.1 hypothetical protein [Candidatus Aminicenantes bacterium]